MAYIYDLTDTWNAGGTTFNAIKMNVTDSASAVTSKLVSLQTNGTEHFSVTKAGVGYVSGNLGVGTSSPGAKLDVAGAGVFKLDGSGSTTPLILRNNNTASVQAVKLGFDSNGAVKASINAAVYGNDYMTFNVGSDTERMRIDASGNVGIGTSSPAYPLQVRRAGGAGSLGISIDSVGTTDRAVQYFAIQDNAAGSGSGHAFYYRAPSSTTDTLGLMLDEGGNVGIGTSSPTGRFAVVGSAVGAGIFSVDTDATRVDIQSYNKPLAINRQGNNTLLNEGGGNVGIGTSAPGAKLDVRGVISGGDGTIQTVVSYLAAAGVTGTVSNHPYVLYANNAERMRIDTSGNLLVGTTSSTGSLTNNTPIFSGIFQTRSSTTASLAAGATEDITGLTSGAAYLVVCRGSSNTTTFVMHTVYVNAAGGVTLATLSNGNGFVLTSPANNTLRVTGLVTTQTYPYSLTRIF